MARHSVVIPIASSTRLYASLRASIDALPAGKLARMVRTVVPKSFVETIYWTSVSDAKLEGHLGRAYGKVYKGLMVTLIPSERALRVTVAESGTMLAIRWILLLTPCFWVMLPLTLVWTVAMWIGIPKMAISLGERLALLAETLPGDDDAAPGQPFAPSPPPMPPPPLPQPPLE